MPMNKNDFCLCGIAYSPVNEAIFMNYKNKLNDLILNLTPENMTQHSWIE